VKIFIDDSGDFGWTASGVSLFCAMILSDRSFDAVTTDFSKWKSRQPHSTAASEIKGKDLSQIQQATFAQVVVLENSGLWLTLAGTKTTLFKREIAEEFVRNSAAIVRAVGKRADDLNKPILTEFFGRMARWIEKRSPENVLWLLTLVNAIHLAMQHSIVIFAEEKHDSEFENIEILIDESFIKKPSEIEFWGEWLRNLLLVKSEREPVNTIKQWSERDHPFKAKYRRKKGILDFSDLFRNHMHFVDSKKVLGVQIADVCANICYRRWAGKTKYRPYRLLRSRVFGRHGTEMHTGILNESSLLTDAPENHVHFYEEEDLERAAE
jgi:Protein of unknown function (DUF3800)